MFAALRKPKLVPVAAAAPAPAADTHAAVRAIGHQASHIGRQAAEVRGVLDDTIKTSASSARTVTELAKQADEVLRSQDAIARVAHDSLGSVERARAAVAEVSSGVAGIVATLSQVAQAAGSIARIALQTRLVAFNASVEAKRAGDAGRGFGVVADAVKDLAGKVESSSRDIMATVGELNGRIERLSREIEADARAGQPGAFYAALGEMQSAVASITTAADASRAICATLDDRMAAVARDMQGTGASLDAALSRSEGFLKVSEELIELVAHCGIETDDTPYIRAAQEAAAQIAALLDDALRSGAITQADLYDEHYRPLPGTNPAQHGTRFVDLADRLFPQVQEPMLDISDKVVFCIAVDRNGYVATHNRKYNQPQRGDLAWDTANSRWRRIFNDRTGLASARNTRPFLLQTYRRDMGGGQYVVMKEAAAPITVAGRHWGGLRLAFKF